MASMKPTLLIFTGLTVALALPAYADFSVGQRVPAPTAAGQSVTSTPTAPFTWTPVTLPYGLNGTGQMAVGGTVDATTRLSVNPQGTAENGLTVNMSSGATGYGLQVKSSTNTLLTGINGAGTIVINPVGGGSSAVTIDNASGFGGIATFKAGSSSIRFNLNSVANLDANGYPLYIGVNGSPNHFRGSVILNGGNYPGNVGAANPLLVGYASVSQTADLMDFNTSTGTNIAKVSNGGGLTNTGYSLTNALSAPTGLAVTTAGTAGTTTYRYYVVAVSGTGSTTVSNEAVVTTANAALTSTNYNAVSWTATPGAETYSLYRTPVSGASGTEGLIVAGLTSVTYADYIAAPVGAVTGYTVAGAGTTAVNGSYIPVTGAGSTYNGAVQYTNGTYWLAYNTNWSIQSAISGNGVPAYAAPAGGTVTYVPPTGWTTSLGTAPAPTFTATTGAPVPGATYPIVNTTGYHNAASYQVGGVAGVTATLADGSAVTKGIVTAPGTTIVGNGSQVTVGGTLDATTRLSVNPQGTTENGLTVNMPSGATGNAFQVKNSTGTAQMTSTGPRIAFNAPINSGYTMRLRQAASGDYPFFIESSAGSNLDYFDSSGTLWLTGSLKLINGGDLGPLGNVYVSYLQDANSNKGYLTTIVPGIDWQVVNRVAANVPLAIQSASGQTADLMDFNTSTNAVGAKIGANFNATFPAVLTAISTKTAAYTLTATDTTILMNGAFAVTLPTASATLAGHSWTVKQIGVASSTVVGTVDGNTGGYTLAAQFSFVTIICDGTNYWITGKG